MSARQTSLYALEPRKRGSQPDLWHEAEQTELSSNELNCTGLNWASIDPVSIHFVGHEWPAARSSIKPYPFEKSIFQHFPTDSATSIWNELLEGSERHKHRLVGAKFSQLSMNWRNETMFLSDPSAAVMNINYLRIIALGESAIQFIRQELEKSCEHWFVALEAITSHTPELGESESFTPEGLRKYWLNWLSTNR